MKNKSIQILMKSKMILATALLVAGISFSLNSAYAAETDEEVAEETAEGEEGEESTDTSLTATPSYDIPDNASFVYEDVEYKPIDHYDPSRAPMNGEPITVNYKGEITPAYYWAPGDMVVFQVSLADEDIPKFEDLSQEDQDTWKSFLSEAYKTPEEAYYAEMLPTYTFYFDFNENKIVPFVEFDFGKDGKVVMMPYDKENQGFYLEELSPSFLKLGNFEFATYQFLTINDDTCYHILSCMDQIGNVYLYQYDANGNSCARADVNMLIGLRYLAERTVALNEYIDKVQWYQDIVRKIIAGLIIAAVVAVFAVIFVKVGKRKNDDDDEEEDEYDEELVEEIEEEPVKEVEELPEIDIEVPEEEDEDEILPEIQLEPEALLEEEDVEQEEVEEETPDLSNDGFVPDFEDDVTEGGLFYAADTEEMKALFKEPVDDEDEEDEDEYEDEDDEDDFFEDEEEEEIEEVIEEEPSEPSVPEHAKKSLASIFDDDDEDEDDEDEEEDEKPRRIRKEKKEKVKKEKKAKEKPKKRRKYEEDDEDEEEDSNDDDLEILDLNDL